MPGVPGHAAEEVRLGRCLLQGLRLLPHRLPRGSHSRRRVLQGLWLGRLLARLQRLLRLLGIVTVLRAEQGSLQRGLFGLRGLRRRFVKLGIVQLGIVDFTVVEFIEFLPLRLRPGSTRNLPLRAG
ncbi:hypothetical protein GCM10009672_17100 [Nesterenkonia lutea]